MVQWGGMETNLLNFDATVDENEDGTFARVVASPAGEAVASFRLPFAPPELTQAAEWLAADSDSAAAEQTLRGMGGRLFQAFFQSNIRTCWAESQRLAYHARAHLRLRLQVMPQERFANLPWEYLYDETRKEYLALASYTPLIRYLGLMHQIVPLKVAAPLRMLVIIPSPGGHPLFDADDVWLAFVDTLDHLAVTGQLLLERVVRPTLHDLQRRLRQGQYHILHFIGHSRFEPLAEEPFLLFEDEMGRPRQISGLHLAALVRDHFPLRLVTIQACPVARVEVRNPYLRAAHNLVQRGLPAAVALQQPISSRTMLTFCNAFYQAIAAYVPFDAALTTARRAVWLEQQSAAWGAVAGITRVADGVIFQMAPPPAPSAGRVHKYTSTQVDR